MSERPIGAPGAGYWLPAPCISIVLSRPAPEFLGLTCLTVYPWCCLASVAISKQFGKWTLTWSRQVDSSCLHCLPACLPARNHPWAPVLCHLICRVSSAKPSKWPWGGLSVKEAAVYVKEAANICLGELKVALAIIPAGLEGWASLCRSTAWPDLRLLHNSLRVLRT